MKVIALASIGALAVIAAYALLIYLDSGYLTRTSEVMLGVLIVAGFAFVLGIGFLFRRRRPPRNRAGGLK